MKHYKLLTNTIKQKLFSLKYIICLYDAFLFAKKVIIWWIYGKILFKG